MVEEVPGPSLKGILYDVDGTLLDTNYLHVLAWSRAFRDTGRWASMSALHALIGMGSDRLIDHLVGGEHPDLDEAHSRHYDALADDVTPIRGAAGLLRETARRGARVVLATSAKGSEVERILDTLDARDAIHTVVSSADVDRSKPDPAIFELALERAELAPERAIVVGDAVWDIEAARRAGLAAVAVTTGGIAREVLQAAGAAAVYESVEELLRQLDQSPLADFLT